MLLEELFLSEIKIELNYPYLSSQSISLKTIKTKFDIKVNSREKLIKMKHFKIQNIGKMHQQFALYF